MEDKLREEIWNIGREYASISGVMRQDQFIADIIAIIERRAKEAFEQSRLTHPMAGFKYDTFEDYKSANENP